MEKRKREKHFLFLNYWKSNLQFLMPSSSSIFPCSKDASHTVTLLLNNLFPIPFEKYLAL